MKGFSVELDWIPKDQTIEEDDFEPNSKKQPYTFPICDHIIDKDPEGDKENYQEKECIQIPQMAELNNEVSDSEVIKSQKFETRKNKELYIQELIKNSQKSEFIIVQGDNNEEVEHGGEEVVEEIHVIGIIEEIKTHKTKTRRKTKIKRLANKQKHKKTEAEEMLYN